MNRSLHLKHPNGFILGVASYRDAWGGWMFFPKVSGRSPSRKAHPTADACLPAWARKMLVKGCSLLPPDPPNDPVKDHVKAVIRRIPRRDRP